ncbi:pre-peptidase C-terminal domain-containing protein [Undibacterium umbellatum]|uniref:Pre-peptidase C-terminal domain-containing protein n=1 Tax=Undibacterium umbellatum TaxID=2762300 RepID=A0ABR6Z9Y6_9BURK|nr:pre-peptidase C-terminal domain-containing protein [Undibacterium umbellatum]MBC3907997.1 pre-peptidase C-terminal domain-containing protein [Undibacterium umbellatum]
MRISCHLKIVTGVSMALAMMFNTAQAAEAWAPTATKATVVPPALTAKSAPAALMQAGAPTRVVVALKLRNKAELDTLTTGILNGKNTRSISSAEFMSRYAPTTAQVQAVVNHLKSSGFVNISVSDNRMLVTADGAAATVKTAFNADLKTYSVQGRSVHVNTTDAQVPQSLADTVLAVHGLQNLHTYRTNLVRPHANTLAVGGHNPTEFSAIYNASSLPSAVNATIGIITQGSMTQTIKDLNTFTNKAGYPTVNVETVTIGAPSSDTSGVGEWNMDTQDALATAGGTIKKMVLYTATTLNLTDITAAYNRAVSDNVAKVINVSLGMCENDAFNAGITASNDQIFQTAVAQGQTFAVSSGDSGAYECGGPGTSQSYPSASPYVISVGGTLLNTSGTTRISETVWACTTAASCQADANGGAGGGPSLTESAPSWQISSGVLGSSTKRGTPDISFNADPASGALVIVNGGIQQIGGTSLAAPIFTGFWARVQSMNNNSLPFPAAAIYQKAASTPGMFYDITSGSNGGYSATAGWDYASGYGSLNMANFAAAMGSTPPPPNVLVKDVPTTGINLATGANRVYTFAVPAGASNLTFKTTGGSGDADLYVQVGAAPSTTTYLQKSDGSTSTETITIAAPTAGTYYVLLNGYTASNGISLVASYQAGIPGNVLNNGVPVTGINLASGASSVYTFVVPAGRPSVTFKTSGGSGDADLYVKLGSAPTTTSYLQKSNGASNNESITINTPAAGTYYVLVKAYSTISGVTLLATN